MKRVSLLIGFTFLLCGLVTAQGVDDNDISYSIDYKQKFPEYPVATEIDTILPGKSIILSWNPVRKITSSADSLIYVNTLWDKVSDWSNIAVKWQPQLPIDNSVVYTDTLRLTPGRYYTFRIWSWLYRADNTDVPKWVHSMIPGEEVGVYLGFKDDTSVPQVPVMFKIMIIR